MYNSNIDASIRKYIVLTNDYRTFNIQEQRKSQLKPGIIPLGKPIFWNSLVTKKSKTKNVCWKPHQALPIGC